jgi:hypothetical protein
MAHDVFISYAVEDRTVANAVCATLEANRIRCWIAPRDVLPGVSYAEALVDAISESSLMVLVFSSRSNNSPHVMREVERAASKGIPILPFRIEDVAPSKSMEFFLSTPHWLDALTPPLEKHLGHLAGTVEMLLSRIRKPKEGTEKAESVESGGAVGPAIEGAPGAPTPVRKALRVVKRWGSRPIVLLGAAFGAAMVGVVVAILVLVGLSSEDNAGSVVLPSATSGGPSPTAARTPPPSPTRASGELVTGVTAQSIGGLGGRIHGITWDGTDLWLSAGSDLFKMDTSGKVLGSYSVPEVTSEGLTWDGETFWVVTTNWGYIYQFTLDESGGVPEPRVISSFPSPNRTVGGGRYDGLAWDGAALWYSDDFNVYRLDTAGNVLSSFALDHEVTGLAWDGEHLWLAYNPSGSGEYATFMKTDAEGNNLLSFSGLVTDVDALAWMDGHLLVVGTENLPGTLPSNEGQQLIYEVVELETIVVGLTPTATPRVIQLTPTAAPTVAESEATTWSGTTSQGRSVEFDIIEGGEAINRIKFDVEGECPLPSGGTGLQPTGCTCEVNQETKMTKPWPIAETGFSYAPGDFEFSAVFDSSTTASGFVRIHSSGTAGQAPCSSDQVTWTASPQ